MPVTADQLNSLVDWVKRNTITAGVGYTLSQSPGGTSLSLRQENVGGLSGGGGASLCAWRVEDISVRAQSGKLNLKLRVYCTAIQPSGKYPDGTSESVPYKDIDLGENREAGWTGVYVEVNVNQKNEIIDGEGQVVIREFNGWAKDSSVRQITYIAGVTISDDGEGGVYISYIDNYCPNVVVKPAPTCPFLIEDYTIEGSENLTIAIRSTAIQRHYPDGMNDTDTYTLAVSDDQLWHAVYCILVTDQQGNINFAPDEGNITLSLETEYKDSTATETYFLIGEVNSGYDADGKRVIDYIYNSCAIPSVSGAINPSTGIVIARGTSQACPFLVSDASIGEAMRIEVAQAMINNRWPDGMGIDEPAYLAGISASSYVYAAIVWDTTTMQIGNQTSDISIVVEIQPKDNTTDTEYILLATVTVGNGKIKKISNVCMQPSPDPCALDWSTA